MSKALRILHFWSFCSLPFLSLQSLCFPFFSKRMFKLTFADGKSEILTYNNKNTNGLLLAKQDFT